MTVIVEDLIKAPRRRSSNTCAAAATRTRPAARKIATVLRAVADDLEA